MQRSKAVERAVGGERPDAQAQQGGAELLSVLVDDNGFKGRGGPLQANITVSIRLLEEGFKHD